MLWKADSPDEPKEFRSIVVHGGCGTALSAILAATVALAGCTSHKPGAPSPARVTAQQLARSGATGVFWGHTGGILDYQTLVDASGNGARVAVISVRGPVAHPPDDSVLLCPSRGSTVHAAKSSAL